MITQTKVECFLSVARSLNFTEASKELFITQQAVSGNIASLEQDLGFPLFERTSRSVRLTNEGERCYDLFSNIYQQINDLIFELNYSRSRDRRCIHLGYQEWLDFGLQPNEAFKELKNNYPSRTLSGERFPPTTLRERLLNHKLDMIILYKSFFECLNFSENRISCQDLFNVQRNIFVSASHPKATDNNSYRDFIKEPLLFDLWNGETQEESIRRLNATIKGWQLKPKKNVIVSNRDSGYTAAGFGEGIIASSEINRMSVHSTLKKYLIPDSYETIVCVWLSDNKDPAVKEYAKLLLERYSVRSD